MLIPRLWSVAMILAAVIGGYLTLLFVPGEPFVPYARGWDMLPLIFYIVMFAISFAGLGGILASYAYQLDSGGCLVQRSNLLGKCASMIVPDETRSFCGISAVIGLCLFFGLIGGTLIGTIIILSLITWGEGGWKVGLSVLALFVILPLLVRVAMRHEKQFLSAVLVVALGCIVALITFRFLYGGPFEPVPWSELFALFAYIVACWLIMVGFVKSLTFAKRLSFYSKICPVRPSSKA